MEKELPKIDLPEEWIVGTGISKELLSLYTNFPCRIKSEIFVLCLGGEVEASVNLNKITVRKMILYLSCREPSFRYTV